MATRNNTIIDTNENRWTRSVMGNLAGEKQIPLQKSFVQLIDSSSLNKEKTSCELVESIDSKNVPYDNIDAKIAFTGNPINLIYVPEQLIGSSTSFEIAPNCQTSNVQVHTTDDDFKIPEPEVSWDLLEDLSKAFVQVDLPEIKFLHAFDFEKLSDSQLASHLAAGCQLLIEKFEEINLSPTVQLEYTESQIELRRMKNNPSFYQLSLRIHVGKWYELERNNDDHVRLKALAYISRTENENDQSTNWNHSQWQTTNMNHASRKQLCKKPFICNRGESCGFFACVRHTIYREEEVSYAVVRCSNVRVVTICPRHHSTNKQWVVSHDAWKIFLQVVNQLQEDLGLKQLPFERVFINFGQWQSNPESGHAHINMVLTQEVTALARNGPQHLRLLQYAVKPAKDYRFNDLCLLQGKIYQDEHIESQCYETCEIVDEEPYSPDLDSWGFYAIDAKSTIIHALNDKMHGKANKIQYNAL